MELASHNSWSYLKPKKWWMRLFTFMAKCQSKDIWRQWCLYGVKCFDLRVRFSKNGELIVAHGLMEYRISQDTLFRDLEMLNEFGAKVRVLHEARTSKQYTPESIQSFKNFCEYIEKQYPNIDFWCGKNLHNWKEDYDFKKHFTCDERYSSVCPPKFIDDWWPWIYAIFHNKSIVKKGTTKDFLMIDFVNYH